MRTPEYLDAIRAKLHLPSDYALQKPLGVTKQLISKYRNGVDTMSDPIAIRIAEILGIDAAQVLIDAHIERSKTPEVKAAWMAMMDKLSTSFTDLLLALVCANTTKLRADR